jgi:hypothetical protein
VVNDLARQPQGSERSLGRSPGLNTRLALLMLMLAMAWFSHAYALEPLYVSVRADRSVDGGITVTIYGEVTRLNQSAVTLAAVSIQVNDPYGSSVHIALLYSNSVGAYSDEFQLPANTAAGNYTIYVTASKPGFQDAHAKLTFLINNPHFSISVAPTSVAVTKGESATFKITLESRGESNNPVHIDVAGLPRFASYSLSSNNETAPSTVTLSVQTSSDAQSGVYGFTVIGASVEGESRVSAEIVVKEPTNPAYYLLAAFLAVAVLLGMVMYRGRTIRKRTEKSRLMSPEYLEGLPLSSSTLLSLPDHLRKTATIVCQLTEASAGQVAARSGRARAAESDYLNQLARMGILKKKRKGRESYFSVE